MNKKTMTKKTKHRWEKMRTDETRMVENVLRTEFPNTDAYRYNSASIRVRIVDPKFEGKSTEKRDAMVERLLDQLPDEIQADIMNLLTLYPNETTKSSKAYLLNMEFEDPSPSAL
jgi:stress-induced morphogen